MKYFKVVNKLEIEEEGWAACQYEADAIHAAEYYDTGSCDIVESVVVEVTKEQYEAQDDNL